MWDMIVIKTVKNSIGNLITNHIPKCLKENRRHTIRTQSFQRFHILKSKINFLFIKIFNKLLIHTVCYLRFNSLQNSSHGRRLRGCEQAFIKAHSNLCNLMVSSAPNIVIVLKPKDSLVPVRNFVMEIGSISVP